jgi:hypothetical protein
LQDNENTGVARGTKINKRDKMKVFNINPLSPTIIYYNGDKFTYNSDMYEVMGSSPLGFQFSDLHSQKNNPLLKIVNLNRMGAKTFQDALDAKAKLEGEIGHSVVKFEQEFGIKVCSIGLEHLEFKTEQGVLIVSEVGVDAEIKL